MAEKKKSLSGEPIKLSRVILSFPQLHEPGCPAGMKDSAPAFSAAFLLSPAEIPEHKQKCVAIANEIKRLRAEAWGLEGKPHPKEETKGFPYGKGELKVNDSGLVYAGYEGRYFVTGRSKEERQPRLLDRNLQDIDPDDKKRILKMFYGGAIVTASINFWVQNDERGKAIRCGLRGIQFIEDGTPFGGGAAADDEFDELEETEGDKEFDGFDDDIPF